MLLLLLPSPQLPASPKTLLDIVTEVLTEELGEQEAKRLLGIIKARVEAGL